jgi:hypothetical protein
MAGVLLLTGCNRSTPSFYPLTEGITWVYQLGSPPVGTVTEKTLAPRDLASTRVTPIVAIGSNGHTETFFVAQDATGIYDAANQDPTDVQRQIHKSADYYLRYPIKIGTTWTDTYQTQFLTVPHTLPRTCVIDQTGLTLTVPAGTFSEVIRKKCSASTTLNGDLRPGLNPFGPQQGVAHVTAEHYLWFAPGVGLIKEIMEETSDNPRMEPGGKLVSELLSFSKSK